jgi:hypothetical protein
MSVRCAAAMLACGFCFATDCAAQDEPAIGGIWLPDASRSQRFPAQPPYTDEGRRIVTEWRASHDAIEDDPGKFCQAPGMPSLALGGADYPVEIIATQRQVTILMELHQQIRRVFLGQEHPARPFPQRNGHSIGRFDGDTLVVDTVGIKALTFGSVPHSDRVHVVERIRAIDDVRRVGQRGHDHGSRDVLDLRRRTAVLQSRAGRHAHARVRVHGRRVGGPRGRARRPASRDALSAPQVRAELGEVRLVQRLLFGAGCAE